MLCVVFLSKSQTNECTNKGKTVNCFALMEINQLNLDIEYIERTIAWLVSLYTHDLHNETECCILD